MAGLPPGGASAEAALIGQDPGTVKAEEPVEAAPASAQPKPKRAKAKPKPDQAA